MCILTGVTLGTSFITTLNELEAHWGMWIRATKAFFPYRQCPCMQNVHDFGEVEEMDLVVNCLLRALLLAKGGG